MEYARLAIALVLTWLPGCVWLARLVPRGGPGRPFMVAGYGLLWGLIVVPLVMRGLSAAGIAFSLTSIGVAMTLLLAAGLLLPRGARRQAAGSGGAGHELARNTRWETLVIWLCAALILTRLVTLGMEAGLRPIYGWDGKQHWAKQAKIFFELGAIVPFVSFQEWLALGGEGVFTTVHPDYPTTVPLVQTWTATALGQWHESLISLGWVLCYLAMGLVFLGQALAAGARPAVALAATYMLLSLPYLNIQVALAGYADIFMASCYLAAVAAFFNWSNSGDRGQALMAGFFALACLLIKNEGVFWVCSFVPGLLLAFFGARKGLLLIAGGLGLLLLVLWLVPGDFTVAGQSLDNIGLRYQPESWSPLYQSFLLHDNWHLLSYVALALVVAVFVFAAPSLPRILPVAATVTSALFLYFVLYLFTRHAYGAIEFTSLNRVALHLMPAVGFLATLIFAQLAAAKPAGSSAQTT